MNHKQQKQYYMQQVLNARAIANADKYMNEAVNMMLLNSLLILGDKFDFTKEQLVQFIQGLVNNSSSFAYERQHGGYDTTSADLKEALLTDYDLDFDKEVMTAHDIFMNGLKERGGNNDNSTTNNININ